MGVLHLFERAFHFDRVEVKQAPTHHQLVLEYLQTTRAWQKEAERQLQLFRVVAPINPALGQEALNDYWSAQSSLIKVAAAGISKLWASNNSV